MDVEDVVAVVVVAFGVSVDEGDGSQRPSRHLFQRHIMIQPLK